MSVFAGIRAISSATAAGGATSITISKPTGTQDGDILVLWSLNPRGGTAIAYVTGPDHGFSLANDGGVAGQSLYEKLAASEPASYTFDVDPDGYGGGMAAYLIAFIPGTLAYNESYTPGSANNWRRGPTGNDFEYAIEPGPGNFGWNTVGDTPDTATASYQDVIAINALGVNDADGGAVPTASGYSNYDSSGTLYGSTLTLDHDDFGGGFRSHYSYSKFAHSATPAFYLYCDYDGVAGTGGGLPGGYVGFDQPGGAYQVKVTLDPDAVPPNYESLAGEGGDQGFDEYWDVLHGSGGDGDGDGFAGHHETHELGGGDPVAGVWAMSQAFTSVTSVVVAHEFGGYPQVTVVDATGVTMEVDVVYDSNDQVTVRFSAAKTGTVYLS